MDGNGTPGDETQYAPRMSLRDLYALLLRELGDIEYAWSRGAYWVMDLASYRAIRAAALAGGAVYPPYEQNPETWAPKPEDRLFGLLIEVRDAGGPPHLEYRS